MESGCLPSFYGTEWEGDRQHEFVNRLLVYLYIINLLIISLRFSLGRRKNSRRIGSLWGKMWHFCHLAVTNFSVLSKLRIVGGEAYLKNNNNKIEAYFNLIPERFVFVFYCYRVQQQKLHSCNRNPIISYCCKFFSFLLEPRNPRTVTHADMQQRSILRVCNSPLEPF